MGALKSCWNGEPLLWWLWYCYIPLQKSQACCTDFLPWLMVLWAHIKLKMNVFKYLVTADEQVLLASTSCIPKAAGWLCPSILLFSLLSMGWIFGGFQSFNWSLLPSVATQGVINLPVPAQLFARGLAAFSWWWLQPFTAHTVDTRISLDLRL